jgi:hypothetical protein
MVPNGFSFVPSPLTSLPLGDTKAPCPSATTHGSIEGSSVSARQSLLQFAPAPWKPVVHETPHCAAGHVALPFPLGGAGHVVVHVPQCVGSFGLTHAPLQRISVAPPSPPSLSHAMAHWPPGMHDAWPGPASGPKQTFPQVPQFWVVVGSTQLPLHSSVVGAEHPASAEGEPSDGFIASPGASDAAASWRGTVMIESVPASTGAAVPSLPPSRAAVGEDEEPQAAVASASRYAPNSVAVRGGIEEFLRYPIGRCDGKVAYPGE